MEQLTNRGMASQSFVMANNQTAALCCELTNIQHEEWTLPYWTNLFKIDLFSPGGHT